MESVQAIPRRCDTDDTCTRALKERKIAARHALTSCTQTSLSYHSLTSSFLLPSTSPPLPPPTGPRRGLRPLLRRNLRRPPTQGPALPPPPPATRLHQQQHQQRQQLLHRPTGRHGPYRSRRRRRRRRRIQRWGGVRKWSGAAGGHFHGCVLCV